MNKYRVAPAEQRTHNGRTYASKAEMQYAAQLQLDIVANDITEVIEQPKFRLGCPENVYVPDFLVIPDHGQPYVVDVKGVETQKFKRNKKLWRKYGCLPLHIVKMVRGETKTVDIIPGGSSHA